MEDSCHDESDVLKALQTIPQTLEKLYQVTLDSIKDKKNQTRAYGILVFLAFSFEPLKLDTVAEAALLPHSDSVVNICTSTFVHVEPSTNRIRLAHFSVKEFLVTQEAKPEWYHFSEVEGHRALANETLDCVLGMHGSSESALDVSEDTSSYMLYSASNWDRHLGELKSDVGEYKDLYDKTYCLFQDERSSVYLHWLVVLSRESPLNHDLGKSPLWHACRLGLKPIVERLLGDGVDPLDGDKFGNFMNPMSVAAVNGQFEVLETLLNKSKMLPTSMAASIISRFRRKKPFSNLTPILDRMWNMGGLTQTSEAKGTYIPDLILEAVGGSDYAIDLLDYLLARQAEADFSITESVVKRIIFDDESGIEKIECLLKKQLIDLQSLSECLNKAEYPTWRRAPKALKMIFEDYVNDLLLSEQKMWEIVLYYGAEKIAALLFARKGERPRVTEERLVQAASRVGSANHMRILLDAMEPGTVITEDMLLSAANNEFNSHVVLSVLLDFCEPGTTVGEEIVLAVLSEKYGSALEAMQMLLRRQCMKCIVSEEILESAARNSLEVFELLWKNRGPSITITEKIISSSLDEAPLTRWLWDKMGSSIPLQPSLLEKAVIAGNEEAVRIILEQYPDICPSHSVWEQAAKNPNIFIFTKLIDVQNDGFPVAHFLKVMLKDNDILWSYYGDSEGDLVSILQLLLDRNLVILEAKTVEQISCNRMALRWLVNKGPKIPVTESLLIKIAGQVEIFCSLLEKQSSDVVVTERVMIAAVRERRMITEVFRRLEKLPISDKVLVEAIRQGNGGLLLSFLFKRGDTKVPVTEEVLEEAVKYNSDMQELLRWGKSKLPITRDLLVEAACVWLQVRVLLLLGGASNENGVSSTDYRWTAQRINDEKYIKRVLRRRTELITQSTVAEVAKNYEMRAVFASWLQKQDDASLPSLFEKFFHIQSSWDGGPMGAIDSLMKDPEHKAESLKRIAEEFPIRDDYFDNVIKLCLSVDAEISHTQEVVELVVERCTVKRIRAFLGRYDIQLTGSTLEVFERKVELEGDISVSDDEGESDSDDSSS